MIDHLVLFRWRDGAPQESIDAAIEGLRGLKDQIPGIVDLTCGVNFCDRAKGYHVGLFVRFTDRAALEAYGPHAAHQRVVQELLVPIREDVIALDFEWETQPSDQGNTTS